MRVEKTADMITWELEMMVNKFTVTWIFFSFYYYVYYTTTRYREGIKSV